MHETVTRGWVQFGDVMLVPPLFSLFFSPPSFFFSLLHVTEATVGGDFRRADLFALPTCISSFPPFFSFFGRIRS